MFSGGRFLFVFSSKGREEIWGACRTKWPNTIQITGFIHNFENGIP